jgi:hypothetical protein
VLLIEHLLWKCDIELMDSKEGAMAAEDEVLAEDVVMR